MAAESKSMRVTVYGLWHLGSVTAACLAAGGHQVTGLDLDQKVSTDLQAGKPPIHEPGLTELVQKGLASGSLKFASDARQGLAETQILWVTFDTPVNEADVADVGYVRKQLEAIADAIRPGTLVLISSQVPVGFTAALQHDWQARGLRFAYSPENLRLGKAIEAFTKADRVILGCDPADAAQLTELFAPFCQRIERMSVASAEMTKHALNAFLATSVTFINELARICEKVGADAKEVERGLKSEARIGPKAYLGPGSAFAGGTLARDVQFLTKFGREYGVSTDLFNAVLASNNSHKRWTLETVQRVIGDTRDATAAILGLTYKPGTDTLRRSAAVELCQQLADLGIRLVAHDPLVHELPRELQSIIELRQNDQDAIKGADVAVIAKESSQLRNIAADDWVRLMRHPRVVDPNWFLSQMLASDPRITYIATGRGKVV
jgi:UDPglucose 6-dehydrogenase